MRRTLRIIITVVALAVTAFLVVGYFVPFEDRQGRCTICGKHVYEKYTPLFGGIRWTFEMDGPISRFYDQSNLPEHEHNWEFMGGFTKTNLYGIPAEYMYGPSDPLMLVPDDSVLYVLTRLETRDEQLRFISALNCDDLYVRNQTRLHLYTAFPDSYGSLMEWWEIYREEKNGIFPSELIPGPSSEDMTSSDNVVRSDEPAGPAAE